MVDIMGLMKKAQAVQAKMKDIQEELERLEVEGQSGGGMVKIRLSAKGQMKAIILDPALMTPADKEIAEDLIIAAHADARAKAERLTEEKMQAVAADLPLPPGMKLPF
ncbi:MAG: YbaB/EbfC family nucleoid-associated protein [Roseiarcus sp.]|jgi:DNA-binding YbaB/EbfC family protein